MHEYQWPDHTCFLVASFVLLANAMAGQEAAKDTAPEAVAAASFRAQQNGDWLALVRLAHPAALQRFDRDVLRFVADLTDPANHTPRRAVQRMLPLAFGVESSDQLARLPAETLLVRYFEYRSGLLGDRIGGGQPALPVRILGHVIDGDSIAYVVLRVGPVAFADRRDDFVDLTTLKRDSQGRWRTMLDGGLFYGRSGFGLDFPADDPKQ